MHNLRSSLQDLTKYEDKEADIIIRLDSYWAQVSALYYSYQESVSSLILQKLPYSAVPLIHTIT